MTKIENNDFTIEEKKAPAKKTPAKKMTDAERDLLLKAKRQAEESTPTQEATLDVESIALENQERIDKVVDNTKILSKNLKEYTMRLNSMHEKNNTLQEKLEILDVDSVKVVIPNHTLKAVVTRQIMKVNTQLADSVDEVNEVIEKLYSDDIQEALKDVGRINDLKNRVCDLEDVDTSRLDDIDYEIETAVQNELSNYDYIEDGDVNNIIDDRLDDYITRDDIDHDLKIYGREINELRERLNNTMYNKICRLVKSIFSYNLSNKVRSIFKRNKRKKIDLNEIAKQIKESKK